jgi:hypothetical protein
VIEVIGTPGSEEYTAALAIKDALARLWPGIEGSPADEDLVRIKPNARLAGYKRSEVDIVIAATFARPRYFVPKKPFKSRDGKPIVTKVRVGNFVAAIEVKSQSSDGVRVAGDEVTVRYPEGWKSATEQNIEQVHALAKYLEHQWADSFVFRCLLLTGIPALPRSGGREVPEAGAVALGFTGAEFFTALAGVHPLGMWKGEPLFSSGPKSARALDASIFREIIPSRLDRIRMDRVAARGAEADRIGGLLGTRRVHVRGHGGTGKTVLMLQAAHAAYEAHGRRCLILTYNVALAADIQRLLAMLGIPGHDDGGGVEVRTAISFMISWLRELGIAQSGQYPGRAEYDALCKDALAHFEGETLSNADVQKVIRQHPDEFDYDVVIVDEAQDWPQAEAELLGILYGGHRIAVADGGDQLVRGRPTNWKRVPANELVPEEKSLRRCLRMKQNLGVFANAVGEAAGLNWSVEPNDEAAGGRVLILRGPYAGHPDERRELLESAIAARNEPIDFLHCVPPSGVQREGDRKFSLLGKTLEAEGYEIWDGVDDRVRRDFPRSTEAFRIVQYDSCRGLEGWVTVLDGFDEFWDYKYAEALNARGSAEGRSQLSPRDGARLHAWRWGMIALTRPMDTLVITLNQVSSTAAELLLRLAEAHPDFVEVRE